MNESFFVTGATGFVGFHLTRRLVEAGKRVRCLARPTSNRTRLQKLGVEFVDGDLADLDALRRGATGVAGVFHLAGLTREMQKGEFARVNRDGVHNVAFVCAEIAKKTGRAPTLVSVSSLAGAGPAPKSAFKSANSPQIAEINAAGATFREYPRRLKRETDIPNPVSPYGRSKLAGERELLRFADAVPTTIIRPPFVFGEGDSLSFELFKIAKNSGIFLIPGYLDRYYSFVDVRDLVELLTAAMERGERATPTTLDPTSENAARCSGVGVYFATSPAPLLFSEFGRAVIAAFGRTKSRMIKIPPMGVVGAGVFGEIFKKITKKQAALDWNKACEALSGPWICADEKAARQLGIRFETPIEQQVRVVADWYLREGWL